MLLWPTNTCGGETSILLPSGAIVDFTGDGVFVGEIGVAVIGIGVAVAETGVKVGSDGIGVLVGDSWVAVGGIGVAGAAGPQPTSSMTKIVSFV